MCHTSGNGIEGGALFGELVTAYLFLAGVGAGGVAAASLADLLFVREPFGADVVPDFAEKRPAERLVAGVLALSPENITVHTLAIKRGSKFGMENAHSFASSGEAEAMLAEGAERLAALHAPD